MKYNTRRGRGRERYEGKSMRETKAHHIYEKNNPSRGYIGAYMAAVAGSILMIKEHLTPNFIVQPEHNRLSGLLHDFEESGSEQD